MATTRFGRRVALVLRKDLWRFWPHLLGLTTLMAIQISGVGPLDDPYRTFNSRLPIGFVTGILALLAALVIQEDSPADDRAFWATRSIEPAAVLSAKVLFIGIFLWTVPIGMEALWFRVAGADAASAMLVVRSAIYLAGILAVSAAIGSVTPDLRRYLAVVLGLWMGLAFLDVAGRFLFDSLSIAAHLRVLQSGFWAAIGLALLATQYATRRTGRTCLLGVVGLGGATLALMSASPRLEFSPPDPRVRVEYEGTARPGVQLHLLSRDLAPYSDGSDDATVVTARLGMVPEPGLVVVPGVVRSRLYGNGVDETFELPGPIRGIGLLSRTWVGPADPTLSPVFPGRLSGRGWIFEHIAYVDEAADFEHLSRSDTLDLTFDLVLSELTTIGSLPLEVGATLPTGEGTLAVLGARRGRGAAGVEIGHRWTPGARSLSYLPANPLEEKLYFVLVNQAYGQYLVDTGGSGGGMRSLSLIGEARLDEYTTQLDFDARFTPDGTSGVPDDWFEGAEIRVLEARYAGSIEVTQTWPIEEWPGIGNDVRIDREPLTR